MKRVCVCVEGERGRVSGVEHGERRGERRWQKKKRKTPSKEKGHGVDVVSDAAPYPKLRKRKRGLTTRSQALGWRKAWRTEVLEPRVELKLASLVKI